MVEKIEFSLEKGITMENLPCEIQYKILSFLSLHDIARIRITCSLFNNYFEEKGSFFQMSSNILHNFLEYIITCKDVAFLEGYLKKGILSLKKEEDCTNLCDKFGYNINLCSCMFIGDIEYPEIIKYIFSKKIYVSICCFACDENLESNVGALLDILYSYD